MRPVVALSESSISQALPTICVQALLSLVGIKMIYIAIYVEVLLCFIVDY